MSNNTALTDLICYQNQLTSLDVSNSAALNILHCSFNQLTSLDLKEIYLYAVMTISKKKRL